jgi:UDP-N-acetylglucosamine 2-epimerase (non-hydrolysing)
MLIRKLNRLNEELSPQVKDELMGKDIWVMVGTRPEAIKQVPLFHELEKSLGKKRVALIGTGQHRKLLDDALDFFKTNLDANFNLMRPEDDLVETYSRVLSKMGEYLRKYRPRLLIVQGDTTSAAMAAWAAFLQNIVVFHNEAGLRSHNNAHPFPEEVNRKIISLVAEKHFVPTQLAQKNLEKEGINKKDIHLVGNTGIDSLFYALKKTPSKLIENLMNDLSLKKLKCILLTAHRRENKGDGMAHWFCALRKFIDGHKDLALIFPMHPNQLAQMEVEKYLKGHERVYIMEAINYGDCCHILANCHFVVTDSGGIQEEGSTLGKPVVVCRQTTERQEAVIANRAFLAGTSVNGIIEGMNWALDLANSEGPVHKKFNIFGDGHASQKISSEISLFLDNDSSANSLAVSNPNFASLFHMPFI